MYQKLKELFFLLLFCNRGISVGVLGSKSKHLRTKKQVENEKANHADGSFAEELKAHAKKAKLNKLELTDLPASITDYIADSYSGSAAVKAGMNELGEYLVVIGSADAHKVLLFTATATFSKALEVPAKQKKSKK